MACLTRSSSDVLCNQAKASRRARPCMHAAPRGTRQQCTGLQHQQRARIQLNHAIKDEKAQQASSDPKPNQYSHQQRTPSPPDTPQWLQLQQRWDQLDGPQRGYTVLVGVLVLALLPRVLTLLVLMLERVVVGGLLATEELLLELLLKGGALLGAVAVAGLLVAGIYLFTRKATK